MDTKRYIFTVLSLLISCVTTFAQVGNKIQITDSKNVLYLSSYTRQLIREKTFGDAFTSVFSNENIDISKIELATLNNQSYTSSDDDLNNVLNRLNSGKIDVVVASDMPAVELIMKNYDKFPKDLKFVFTAVIDERDDVKYPSNVYVIRQVLDVKNNLSLGKEIFPKATKAIVLTGGGPSGKAACKKFRDTIMSTANFEIMIFNGAETSTASLLEYISNQNPDSYFIIYHSWISIKDRIPFQFVSGLISDVADGRVLSMTDFQNENFIGGYVFDVSELGAYTGQVTKEILAGLNPSHTLKKPPNSKLAINKRFCMKKGFSMANIPSNAIYYSLPSSLFEAFGYKKILLILSAFTILLIIIFIQNFKTVRTNRKNTAIFRALQVNLYIFTEDGKLLDANSSFGKANSPEIKDAWNKIYSVFQLSRENLNPDKVFVMEFEFQGRMRNAMIKKLPADLFGENTYIVTTEDIDELYRTREKLKKAKSDIDEIETLRKMILHTIHAPILLFDADRNILSANKEAEKLMGATLEQMKSRKCHESICKGIYNNDKCIVKKCIETADVTSGHISFDGRDISVYATPVSDKSGKLKYVVETFIDTTELQTGKRMLVQAMQEVQAANKVKSSFLSAMSHEFRTPLNNVIGYAELMENPDLSPEERAQNLKNISFSANALMSLVNDIIDLSNLEAGNIQVKEAPLEIATIAEEFSKIFNLSAKKKGLSFDVYCPTDISMLMIDALRLKQVLMNVVGNAIKFTEKGGVTMAIYFEKNSDTTGNLLISIKDTGIGIEKKLLEKICNPFEQGFTSIRGRGTYEGVGLGLPIAKKLLNNMGGKLAIDSVPDVGSEFKIVLDNISIAENKSIDIEAPKDIRHEPNGKDVKGFTVLIIDDVLLNLKVLDSMLKAMGINVLQALNCDTAFEILKTEHPDIILTDMWMPRMSGTDFAEIMKSSPITKDIPIIAVTADIQIDNSKGFFKDILFKPITKKSLENIIGKNI